MTPDKQQAVLSAHHALPAGCRCPPASEQELRTFEDTFGPIPNDYRWYLKNCGGGIIGSEWIDGIRELAISHKKFKEERERGFYNLEHFFVIGWDGGGNPYGIDSATGKIVTEDHNFGGIHVVAEDLFDLFVRKGLLRCNN